jgi:hypothetical protein
VIPVYRVYGDFTIVTTHSTFIIKDLWFESPDPTRGATWEIRDAPIVEDDALTASE